MKKKAISMLVAAVLLFTLVLPVPGLAAADYSYIKVYLTSMNNPTSVTFVVKGAYRIAEAPGVDLYPGLTYTMSASDGGQTLSYDNGLGPVQVPLPATATFVQYANGSGVNYLYVNNPSYGWRNYTGSMAFIRQSTGCIRMINTLFFETYLYGVVAYEMSNSWPVEALKTQAVCARTYSLRYMKANYNNSYHIGDTSSNQVYKGLPLNSDGSLQQNVVDAVNATRGQVVCIGDPAALVPADGVFSASNGGQVRTANMHWGSADTYHVYKNDGADLANGSSPKFIYLFPRDTAALNALSGTNKEKATIIYGLLKAKVAAALGYDPNNNQITITGILSATPTTLRGGMPADSKLFTKVDVRVTYTDASATTPPSPTPTPTPTGTPAATPSAIPTDEGATEPAETEQTEKSAPAGGGGAPYASDYFGEMTVTLDYISESSPGNNDWSVYGELKTAFKVYSSLICTKNMWNLYADSDAGYFYVIARGYGHGVGMSQRGAQQMANSGMNYQQILDFYYNLSGPTSELGTLTVTENALQSIPGNAAPQYGTLNVGLNVRTAPNTGATAVATLPQGTQVEVLGAEGDWYRVLYAPAGIVGWACYQENGANYITLAAAPEPTLPPVTGKAKVSSYLSLRKTASSRATRLAKIPKNGAMTVLQVYSTSWLKVAYGDKTGFVLSSYVIIDGNKSYDVATVTKATLNVRKAAGSTQAVLGVLKKGDNVVVTGYKTVKKVKWYKIKYQGGIGWLDSRYVKKGA